jgi:E3 ubiquitin-protein ligase SHPRH
MTQPSLTVCGHYFDYHCLTRWLKGKDTPSCPTCRRLLQPDDYAEFSTAELPAAIRYDAHTITRTSSHHAAVSSSTVPATAGASSAAGDAADGPTLMPTLEEIQRQTIVGEGRHGSKVETICKYIKHLHRANTAVKVLVFSQYHRMLEMVGHALAQNNITSLHLSGTPLQRAKQIDRFQSDSSCTAFLMSLRNDNSGLTLVSATAVFLMEPSLNPSIEAQAVNRIHRIGQTRETHVFKFLMRRSVEQAIDELTTHDQRQESDAPVQTGGEALIHQSKEVSRPCTRHETGRVELRTVMHAMSQSSMCCRVAASCVSR